MLSPKARNCVTASIDGIGGGVTTTSNEHGAALRAFASLTVHVTVVVPTGNFVPLAAVQDGVVSGGAPPFALAAPKTTTAPDASKAWIEFGAAGHESVGAPGSIGVGFVGSLHPAARPTAATRIAPLTIANIERGTAELHSTDGSDDRQAGVSGGAGERKKA